MNKLTLLVLNVIFFVTMLTHGVHTGVENQNGQSPAIPASSTTLHDGLSTEGEGWSLDNETSAIMLEVCGGAETAVPSPPASPDGPIILILPLAIPAHSDLVPPVIAHAPPTCSPDVRRAFLQVFRN